MYNSEHYAKYAWIQHSSLVFVNFNHCIKTFIYMVFHDGFRKCLKQYIYKLLNFCKNKHQTTTYLKSKKGSLSSTTTNYVKSNITKSSLYDGII